jgi:hypothetical protein
MDKIISIVTTDNPPFGVSAHTNGLKAIGHPELWVEVSSSDLRIEAEQFLRCISDYVVQCGVNLSSDETVSYGYWLTKFKEQTPDTLETWELDSTATEYVKGASLTLQYWKDQHLVCQQLGAAFEPPRGDQLSMISKGVFEGLPVQGVRYASPDHMSGWWISTDQYDGNIKSMRQEHTYHVTCARPDLAKYLALPPGYRFDLSSFEDIWFDEQIILPAEFPSR